MAIFRILEATARPGAMERLSHALLGQERKVVAGAPGILFVQTLHSGDSVLGVSSWRSVEDMERYLQQPATRQFYAALPELLMGMPSIRTFEEVRDPAEDAEDSGGSGWGTT